MKIKLSGVVRSLVSDQAEVLSSCPPTDSAHTMGEALEAALTTGGFDSVDPVALAGLAHALDYICDTGMDTDIRPNTRRAAAKALALVQTEIARLREQVAV